MAKQKWMSGAVNHPGALRATAKSLGYISGDEPLTFATLDKLAAKAADSGNSTLAKRVNLARTMMRSAKS